MKPYQLMHVSLKVILHSKVYSDGTSSVMLQCIARDGTGKVWKRRTLCKVKPAQFDKVKGRIKNHPNAHFLNAKIAEAHAEGERRILKAQMEGRKVDPELIIAADLATGPKPGMLIAQGNAYVEQCRQKGMFHTSEKYGSHVLKLAQFLGKDKAGEQIDIHMDDVTESWMLAWAKWLKENGTKSANTLHRRMAFVTTLFNDARKRGLTKADPMAFLEFKEQKVRKPKLTSEQIVLLEKATGLSDRQQHAINTFLLQFYAYGTRISDALCWQKRDVIRTGKVWHLQYTTMKTGTLIDVRLSPKAKDIISYYLNSVPGPFLLPWLADFTAIPSMSGQENKERLIRQVESKTAIVNGLLTEAADKLKLGVHLTTHIARHTFATLADKKIADKRKISAALGQARFSTTEVYLAELRQDDINDAMDVMWE